MMDIDEVLLGRRLERHVWMLAEEIGERNLWRYGELQKSADYIAGVWEASSYQTERQAFQVNGREVHNLVAQLTGKGQPDQILVIGAHYDSVLGCPGANDNGSGVAALLEMARLLAGLRLHSSVRFVAFVNEEPPFFQTRQMGSWVYASRCRQRRERIYGMLSLETIGYYSDLLGSQRYPIPFALFYPDTANFIGIVGNLYSNNLVNQVTDTFRRHSDFPSESLSAPGWMTGVGWSDQWAFWKEGYKAVMVTDTAQFRYKAYHTPHDTPEKVIYPKMAQVVAGMTRVVVEMASSI